MASHHKLIQEKRIFMNTEVEFSAWTNLEREAVHELYNQGFEQFDIVVDRFSRFDKSSELSKLNQALGKERTVSKELFSLIEFALMMATQTDGAFDPTVIDFLQTYGYDAKYSFDRLRNKALIQSEIQSLLKKRHSYKEIKLDKQKYSITLMPGQRFDLGSIGKGYAIDRAAAVMQEVGNLVINAGGDIWASGTDRTDKPWLVDVKPPKSKSLGTLQLKDCALCCSGSWARKVKFFHHLIDPKTGAPQDIYRAVFVLAPRAIEADAWATALYALGKKAGDYINKYHIRALLVTEKDEIINYDFPLIQPI